MLQRCRHAAVRFDAIRSASFAAMDTCGRRSPFGCCAAQKNRTRWEGMIVIHRLLSSAFVGLGLLLVAPLTQAHAQSPAKTITLVVPYAAGGGTDTVARLIGERMSRTLGQAVIIENQVGGGSTLAN